MFDEEIKFYAAVDHVQMFYWLDAEFSCIDNDKVVIEVQS